MGSKIVPRGKVRLRLDRGTALIKHLGAGSVHCELTDISEGGCQCRISLSQLSSEAVDGWRAALEPGRVLTVEITEPPEMHGILVPAAEVRWVQLQPTEFIFGVSLKGLSDHHSKLLSQSLMTVASKKLRAKKDGAPVVPPPAEPAEKVRKPMPKRRFETSRTQLNS